MPISVTITASEPHDGADFTAGDPSSVGTMPYDEAIENILWMVQHYPEANFQITRLGPALIAMRYEYRFSGGFRPTTTPPLPDHYWWEYAFTPVGPAADFRRLVAEMRCLVLARPELRAPDMIRTRQRSA